MLSYGFYTAEMKTEQSVVSFPLGLIFISSGNIQLLYLRHGQDITNMIVVTENIFKIFSEEIIVNSFYLLELEIFELCYTTALVQRVLEPNRSCLIFVCNSV